MLIILRILLFFGLWLHPSESDANQRYDEEEVENEISYYKFSDHQFLLEAPAQVYVVARDPKGNEVVVVIHYSGGNLDPVNRGVLPNDETTHSVLKYHYFRYLMETVVDVSQVSEIGEIRPVVMHHIVMGARIPQTANEVTTLAVTEYDLEIKLDEFGYPVASYNVLNVINKEIKPSSLGASSDFEEYSGEIDVRIVESWRKQSEVAQQRIEEQLRIHKDSVELGTVYRGFDHWVYYQDPVLMAAIFNGDGRGYNLDLILPNWVTSYDALCGHRLEGNSDELKSVSLVEQRRRLTGRLVSSNTQTDHVRVAKHFTPYMELLSNDQFGTAFMEALNQLERVLNGDVSSVFEVSDSLSAPMIDTALFIRSNGCDSNAVNQFDLNLLHALGGGENVQQSGVLDRTASASESSRVPSRSDFLSLAEACWSAKMYVSTSLKPVTPQICVCEETAYSKFISPELMDEALSDYPKFSLFVRTAKTPEYEALRRTRYQKCRPLLE